MYKRLQYTADTHNMNTRSKGKLLPIGTERKLKLESEIENTTKGRYGSKMSINHKITDILDLNKSKGPSANTRGKHNANRIIDKLKNLKTTNGNWGANNIYIDLLDEYIIDSEENSEIAEGDYTII